MKPYQGIGIVLLFMTAVVAVGPALAVDEARQAYDRMVEEATKEADEYMQEKQKAIQETKKKSETKRDAEMEKRVAAERQRIIEEMDAVQQRGLGPNYTLGMKDNQLKQLQNRLDRLMNDPVNYFGGQ